MKNTIPIYQVDAFAHQPFTGNPAAVCLLQSTADTSWMQSVATEMNLSETAFVQQRDDPSEGFDLRWFTPTIEVDLCGHATLATAHILWEQGWLKADQSAQFHTRSGVLIAQKKNHLIQLDFPATPAQAIEIKDIPSGILQSLGINVAECHVFFNQVDYLIQLDDAKLVRELQPDFPALSQIDVRGVMVTALSNNEYDFISRFFAPASGINEDPVTGSAHCTLAPFWSGRLNKNTMRAYQASNRGGEIGLELQNARVLLTGRAITVLAGEFYG